VAPKEDSKQRGRLTAPTEPGEISQAEFQELVRDIHEPEPAAKTARRGDGADDRTRDLDPDEVVMPKAGEARQAAAAPKPPPREVPMTPEGRLSCHGEG